MKNLKYLILLLLLGLPGFLIAYVLDPNPNLSKLIGAATLFLVLIIVPFAVIDSMGKRQKKDGE